MSIRRSASKFNHEKEVQSTVRTAVRLPPLPTGGGGVCPRPARCGNDAVRDTLRSFEHRLGIKSRDYAVRCLELAQRFNERPWLQQVRQAVAIATIGVKRVYGHEPHLFAGDSAVV